MADPIQLIIQVKQAAPHFLDILAEQKKPGFYHYSVSGDILPTFWHWGLGNSVFFLKSAYTLGLEKQYQGQIADAVKYIQTFNRPDGTYRDPYVRALSLPRRLFRIGSAYSDVIRAETRQSISALALFKQIPSAAYKNFCHSVEDINIFFESLDWSTPWHAASHVSHEMFFLYHSEIADKDQLVQAWLAHIRTMQQEDGAWYRGEVSLQQKINGAMKIITGLNAIGRVTFDGAEALIDLCLSAVHDTQACDNFNIVYVLTYADVVANHSHRHEEIVRFMLDRLSIYAQYYHSDVGGFSFQKERANVWYYGAPLTFGKREPDIHGTTLFLWGMSLIARVLEREDIGLHEFAT